MITIRKFIHGMNKTTIAQLTKLILAILGMITLAPAVTYYVDAMNGSDANSGLTPAGAWQSLAQVNATTFQPGDSIMFKGNDVWNGQLYPLGSGTENQSIVLDTYGEGNRPIIDGAGMTKPVIYLYNQEYWEIRNLEITNSSDNEADRVGVRVEASNFGTIDHIYLKNLYIHHISGIIGNTTEAKRTGGINFRVLSETTPTRFNDILIENCEIVTVNGSGISNEASTADYPGTGKWYQRKYTNYIIRSNSISDISKNAIIMRMADSSCVVEYNVCWNTSERAGTGNTIFSRSCLGTIFQYNEGYLNKTTDYDGCLYDADLSSPKCIFQYSYSHDNNHGLFWTCTTEADDSVICRYNISQNDKGNIFTVNYPNSSVFIYNNTVYCGNGTSPTIISERNNGPSGNRTYYFYNNIIYCNSTNAKYKYTSGYNRFFNNNCFFGYHPSNEPTDLHKITSDPMLDKPGSGRQGILSVSGYRLKSGSPCIDAGIVIENNGGLDYFGNPLYNGAPDIGAHEYYMESSLRSEPGIDWLPCNIDLYPNYPNPFNPATTIAYRLENDSMVTLEVYNVLGEKVCTLANTRQVSGEYRYHWNARNQTGRSIPCGVYYVKLTAGDEIAQYHRSRPILLLK